MQSPASTQIPGHSTRTALDILHDKAGQDTVFRIELLEGVRGALATWVMLGHIMIWVALLPHLLATAPTWLFGSLLEFEEGYSPVSIFMMLSGFVISHLITTRREPYRVYITRRFLRLYPAFLCCLALGIAVTPLEAQFPQYLPWYTYGWIKNQVFLSQEFHHFMIPDIAAELTMLQGLVPRNLLIDASGPFLGVAWSISTEWQFYLVAPFALRVARNLRGIAVLCLVVICLSPGLPMLQLFDIFRNGADSFLGFKIQYFFIGGISYAIWRVWREYLSTSGRPPPQGLVLIGATAAFFAPNLHLACWVFIFSCLCQIAAAPAGIEARMVQAVGCSKPVLFLGRISYSIYLSHWPLCILMLKLTRGWYGLGYGAYAAVYMVLTSLLTIAVSTALYYFVEAPMIRHGKEMFQSDLPIAWHHRRRILGTVAIMITMILIACAWSWNATRHKPGDGNTASLAVAENRKLDEQIAKYRHAIAINPDDLDSRKLLGNLFQQAGRPDEAIAEYQNILDINPRYVEALNNLGAVLQQQGRVDEAIADYKKAIKIQPDYTDALNNLGAALHAEGRLADAIASYEKALELKPDYAQAEYNLGRALEDSGNTKEAIAHYQKAVDLKPDYVKAQSFLALVLATCPQDSLRNGARALLLARQANQWTGGSDPNVMCALAAAYAECGRFSEAVQTAQQALALAGSQSNAGLQDALKSQIKLYQANMPLRDQ